MIQYGRQSIQRADIDAVAEALEADFLTTGPAVAAFEQAVAERTGSRHAVAVSSGTAALHAAAFALGLTKGDEVIVPTITFAATAAAVAHVGATPVFADVCPDTLLLTAEEAERRITPRTRAVFAVDYAGQPCDYQALRALCERRGLALLADACHSLGATQRGVPVGSLADLTVFSFHPVKSITTGEGGMITTNSPELCERMRLFRNHGITRDAFERDRSATWEYDIDMLGLNYRLTDFQSALGLSQLQRLDSFLARRSGIAARYDERFRGSRLVRPVRCVPEAGHAHHLYVVRIPFDEAGTDRRTVYREMKARGIGTNVHYIPVHLLSYYRKTFGTGPGLCPAAEAAYETILSLPIHPSLADNEVDLVAGTLLNLLGEQP